MLCLGVIYTFPAERVEDASTKLAIVEQESNREPGCKMFVVHQSQDDPATFFLYEQYDDQAAFEAHQQTSHFKEHVLGGLRQWAKTRTAVIGHRIVES